MSFRWHSGLAAVVLVCTVMSLSAAADVAGKYSCRGSNPGSTDVYTGTVDITASGGGYKMSWNIGGKVHGGIAILTGGHLSSSWGNNGIVVYKVEGNGKLVGTWLNPSGGELGTETLTPQ